MSGDLEPCPFCGSRDVRYQECGRESQYYCGECGASTVWGAEAEALAAWNRRSEPRGDSPLAPEGAPQLASGGNRDPGPSSAAGAWTEADFPQSVLRPLAFRMACREGTGENVAIGQTLRREIENALTMAADAIERLAEAFVAGWEACDRKWEGPSAAGYPTDVDAAWELYSPFAAPAGRDAPPVAVDEGKQAAQPEGRSAPPFLADMPVEGA